MVWSEPIQRHDVEYEIKRSRFIAIVEPVFSSEQVKTLLGQIRHQYKGANHYCSAYVLGDAQGIASRGKSDDGEPSGTAGQPMLSVLEHHHLVNTLVVVVRYFGGIKLGAGGLVRAYSTAVSQAVESLEVKPLVVQHHFSIVFDYAHQSDIEYRLTAAHTNILQRHFAEQVTFECAREQTLDDETKLTLQRIGAHFV